MRMRKIIAGSRESILAVAQSNTVIDYINGLGEELECALLTMKTTGDRILDRTLQSTGGKGLFVKELDIALREKRADITVHSLKDVPMEVPPDIPLIGYSRREDPRDVLVLPKGVTEQQMDRKLPIGSASLRRALQLKRLYPGFDIEPVRGNLQTRLKKLDEGQYCALVLAAAGLIRLGLSDRISRYFTVDEMIPAAGQGIIAIQGRRGEDYSYLDGYLDESSFYAAECERSFVRTLDGGCSSPIAAHARLSGGHILLRGLYFDEESGGYSTGSLGGNMEEAVSIGEKLARKLKDEFRGEGLKDREGRTAQEMSRQSKDIKKGKVYLVGAGPGDGGLFTLKGREVLEKADVVVYDALVGDAVLSMIPEGARLIYAGKRSGDHALSQWQTNQVLLDEARAGNNVVRLKGGDPFLFGRGGEELELLVQEGIDYEIVPGVTSAIAVPAYAGIPVTHRDFCSSVHIITGHKREGQEYDIDFEALARTRGTLVFLMGIAALDDICAGLLEAGMDPATPAAVLEKGTTAHQRRIVADLKSLPEQARRQKVSTPAIIVVGKVCALAEQFGWYEKLPLGGVKVIITRPREQKSALSQMLRDKGAQVLELPSIRTEAARPCPQLDEAISAIMRGSAFDWIVFTSPSGVDVFFNALEEKCDSRALSGINIASIGGGTSRALRLKGIHPDFMPKTFDGASLGRELAQICKGRERILIPRARKGNPELVENLKAVKGVKIVDVAAYDTLYESSRVLDEKGILMEEGVCLVAFTSASTVKGFVESTEGMDYKRVNAVCIGRQTQTAAASFGMRTWVAKSATLSALTETVVQAADEVRSENRAGASEREDG